VIVQPLRTIGYLFFIIDRLVIDGLVFTVGWVPRMLGAAVRPTQRGLLQGYGLGMVTGVAVIALLVYYAL